MLDIKEASKKIADKIRDPEHWTKYQRAKTKEGYPTDSSNPNAVKWCAFGAAECVLGWADTGIFNIAFRYKYNRDMMTINDRHGHQAILNYLDDMSK